MMNILLTNTEIFMENLVLTKVFLGLPKNTANIIS